MAHAQCPRCGAKFQLEGAAESAHVTWSSDQPAPLLCRECWTAVGSAGTPEHDDRRDLIRYLSKNCAEVLTEAENEALRHFRIMQESEGASAALAAVLGRSAEVDSSEALNLVQLGREAFLQQLCERVADEHPDLLVRCPRCGKVQRPPKTKQCARCSHDW